MYQYVIEPCSTSLNIFLSLPVILSFCCSVFMSIFTGVFLSFDRYVLLFCIYIVLSFYRSVLLSVCLSVFLSFCPCVLLSFGCFVFLPYCPFCLSVLMSFFLSICSFKVIFLTVFVDFCNDGIECFLLDPESHHLQDLVHRLGLDHAVLTEPVEAFHQN